MRLPCTTAELEALRAAMFAACRLGDRLEREVNYLGAAMLWNYAVELAQFLAGERGLQRRLYYWYREARWWRVGHHSRRPVRVRRKASNARRRGRAIDIPGIYR